MKNLIFNLCPLICLCLLNFSESSNSLEFTELDVLKPAQKTSLQKLKELVSPIVPHDYMKEDIYLVKFLQFTSFNIRKSEDMIKETVKWRAENKVDDWEQPGTFTEFEKDYPSLEDGLDRTGRPIREAFYGEWNVRAAALSGKLKRLTNYALRSIERCTTKVREQQALGQNVTQWNMLLNMEGFNLRTAACPTCLPLYLAFVGNYEKYYPNSVYKIILVNTPESFEFIFNLIRPIMSPPTRAALKVFGSNHKEWKAYVDELISQDQITDWFDGTKVRKSR